MNHLHRDLAPIADAGWAAIEEEIKPRLETYLAARKLVDFEGPRGWTHSATASGRTTSIAGPSPTSPAHNARSCRSSSCGPTSSSGAAEVDDAERGADRPRPSRPRRGGPAHRPGREHGRVPRLRGGAIKGITESTSHDAGSRLSADAEHYPTAVAEAVDVLRGAGIGGPYGLALSPGIYTEIVHTAEHGGHLLLDHLRQILGGPLVWAPGVEGGIVLSLRGGDFVFESGQDISIGYTSHDAETVALYLEESFSFRVLEPDAAVALAEQEEELRRSKLRSRWCAWPARPPRRGRRSTRRSTGTSNRRRPTTTITPASMVCAHLAAPAMAAPDEMPANTPTSASRRVHSIDWRGPTIVLRSSSSAPPSSVKIGGM